MKKIALILSAVVMTAMMLIISTHCAVAQEDFITKAEKDIEALEAIDVNELKLNKKEALELAAATVKRSLDFRQEAIEEVIDRDNKIQRQLIEANTLRSELIEQRADNERLATEKLQLAQQITELHKTISDLQATIKNMEFGDGNNINWALLSQYDTDFFNQSQARMIQQTRYLRIATAVAELYYKWNDLRYCRGSHHEMAADNYSYSEVIGTDIDGGDDIAILRLDIGHSGCGSWAKMSLVHLERSVWSENDVLTTLGSKDLFEYSSCENDEFIWPELPLGKDVESAIGVIDKWLDAHNFTLNIIKGNSCLDVTVDYNVIREGVNVDIDESNDYTGFLPPIKDLSFSGDVEFVSKKVSCETAAVTSVTNLPNGNVFVNYVVFLGHGYLDSAPGEDHYVLFKN